MATNRRSQVPLAVAAAAATVVVVCIVIGTILGELPEALWFLLVPVGMLGGAVVCLVSLGVFFARRAPGA